MKRSHIKFFGRLFLLFSLVLVLGLTSWRARADDLTPRAFLPVLLYSEPSYACPATSSHSYSSGVAYQHDTDDPVRPAYNHADKNLALRSYVLNTDPNLERGLVNLGSDDPTQPPQIATLFQPAKVPALVDFYQVHQWDWAESPAPGTRAEPITKPAVTALGLQTATGESLYVPSSGYSIGGGMEILILFADADSITLHYTREDTAALGYTLHIDHICTDPNLLARYNANDDPDGPRYVYVSGSYSYDLPNLPAGKYIGTAQGDQVVVSIVDSGTFMDPRSCNEWWQIRPGYSGCSPAR